MMYTERLALISKDGYERCRLLRRLKAPVGHAGEHQRPALVRYMAQRFHQIVLIGSIILASWLGMQDTHELGHVIGAWLTGGTVDRVVLHPLTISRTDLARNPHPLAVVWAGPVIGSLLPLVAWGMAMAWRWSGAYLVRFFAGFCLVANGAYIAAGSLGELGDAGVMLGHGSPAWLLWVFGLLTVPLGLWLWHRQGPHFGLGPAAGKVKPAAAYGCLGVFIGLVVLGFVVDGK